MRTFALLFFSGFVSWASAQRAYMMQDYKLIANKSKLANTIKPAQQAVISGIVGTNSGLSQTTIIRIPVVVHLLYNTAAQNISDAEIKSGIAALNRDYRRQNSDTVNTPTRFNAVATDVAIEFQLATADPNGRATNGIVRKQTTVAYFEMDDKIKFSSQGGDDAWDTKSYLNIWIGDLRRLLGYSTMPDGDSAVDGVVINNSAFGTLNTAPPYNLGRTVVHEVGHWLGLYHLWGNESCGDDLVDDTPKQGGYTSGCPTGIRSSCSNGPDGDMYMNYMDFTNDACMNLFTLGQKARMRMQFNEGSPRYAILASKGLNQPWVEAAPLPEQDSTTQTPVLQLYPNPATSNVVVQCNVIPNAGSVLYIMNATGALVQKISLTTRVQKITLTHVTPRIYFLQGDINHTKVHLKLVKL